MIPCPPQPSGANIASTSADGFERFFQQLFLVTPAALVVHEEQGRICLVNKRCSDLLQLDPHLASESRLTDFIASPSRAELQAHWEQVVRGKRLTLGVTIHKNGVATTAELQSQVVTAPTGNLIATALISTGRVRSAQKKLEDNLRFLDHFFDTIPCPAFYKDRTGVYLGCNSAFATQIIGIPAAELIGHSLFDLPGIIPHERARIYAERDQKLFDQGGSQVYESKVQCADGTQRDFLFSMSAFENDDGEVAGLCGVMIDLTQKVKAEQALVSANHELQRLNSLDPLTGIANRRRFDAAYRNLWRHHRGTGTPLTVMMLDIDHFKAYNDHYGHPAGDRCIRRVARALASQMIRKQDLVARYGGEEFAVLLPETTAVEARKIAERIRQAVVSLNEPHARSDAAPYLTISVGVATAIPAADDTRPEELLVRADRALYRSKGAGRNRVTRVRQQPQPDLAGNRYPGIAGTTRTATPDWSVRMKQWPPPRTR